MKQYFFATILLGLIGCSVSGQTDDPLVGSVPLVESEQETIERAANRRMWEKAAADNALRSGLATIAIGLYDQLLDESDDHRGDFNEIQLSRISAFIALGRMEEADKALNEFRGEQDSRFILRRSLVSFFLGDHESAAASLTSISSEVLQEYDLAWYYLLLGLVDRISENEEADSLLNRARLLAVSPEQRAQVDLIIYRSVLLESVALNVEDLERLKAETESELEQGSRAGFQFAKTYSIALHVAGQKPEALKLITDTIPLIFEADYDLRDELLLLLGIISGHESTVGTEAFRTLLSSGVITDLRLRALQELVSVAKAAPDIQAFLSFTAGLDESQLPGELTNQILYNRAQLFYRTEEFEASGSECETLLQRDPDVELHESTLRLLVLIAFQRQRYRTASGLLIELSNLVQDSSERNQIQLLVADCFFQAGDYGDAAESYGLAIQQERADRGSMLFQWILSEINAGNLEQAGDHMKSFKDDASIDPVQKWKTLWNLLTALHASGKVRAAFDLLNSWLTQGARDEMPVDLWIRLLWFRCQLSLKTGNFASTPVLAGEVYSGLTDAEGTIDAALGIEVLSLTQVLESQALVFAGRQEEGLELMESIRRDYPSTRAAAESYLAEARFYASENLMVDSQRRLIDLADNYPGSDLAPVALYEAALHTLSRGTDSTRREANLILNRLADNYPEHPLVFYGRLNQGNLLRSFNDFGGAEVVFEQLLLAFPRHKDKAIVEMAQAECILAQTDTSQTRLDQAIGRFERLAELPDLPIDLRVEASWKWAFSYERRGNPERVIDIYWVAIYQFLINEDQSKELGSTGRYWMSRIVISLGESLEAQGDVGTARRVYSYIPDRGLPFNNLAEGKLRRLAQKKD